MKAILEFRFNSKDEALNVYKAVLPEVKSKISEGTRVNLLLYGKTLRLTIDADNISKLRAAINSYGRWVNLSLDIWRIEVGE